MKRSLVVVFALFSAVAAFAGGFDHLNTVYAVAGISTGLINIALTNTVTPTNTSVDWGDGNTTGAAASFLGSCVHCDLWGIHTYARPGDYTVTVKYYTGAVFRTRTQPRPV